MTPDLRRDLTPRDDALRLIDALNAIQGKAHDAARQWVLLDENGRFPNAPSRTALLQHAVGAQDLSREAVRLAVEYAQNPHNTPDADRHALRHLSRAATMSSHAATQFAETMECELAWASSTNQDDRHYLANCMVSHHAVGRAYLRRTSEALRDASKSLDNRLGSQRVAATSTREGPSVPPPSGSAPDQRAHGR